MDKEYFLLLKFSDVMVLQEIKGYISALDLRQSRLYSEYIQQLVGRIEPLNCMAKEDTHK